MATQDVRWKQRLQSYRKALGRLTSAAELAEERRLTDLEQQGLIQAFEFTHELAWNLLKEFLEAHGYTTPIYGSKDATRAAFRVGLISQGEDWMAMIDSRNRTTHSYNEETAKAIADSVLTSYLRLFRELEEAMVDRETQDP